METKIKVKQEVLSELASQNDTAIWYNDCKTGIKTEIKQEAPVPDCFSQDERQLFTKDVKNIKKDTCTHSNDMEMDTKTDIAPDGYSENERQFFPKEHIENMKKCSSDCEVEIKEEPWWPGGITQTAPDCEQITDGRYEAELPRFNAEIDSQETYVAPVGKDKSLFLGQEGSPLKETQKSDSYIKEALAIEESHFSEHLDRHDGGEILSIASIQWNNSYRCDVNDKNITCKSNLGRHNLIDRCGKVCKCNTHYKSFNKYSNKQHSSAYEAADLHKCQVCERTFTQNSDLKRHNLIHQGIKPHKCEICEKTFTRASHLKQHNLIHEGVKPYKCEICDKAFTDFSNLKQHNLLHEGVKPYKCEICEKTFTQMSHLKQHNLIHEGVRQHKCEICEKTFTLMSHLKQHNLIHEGLKQHKCEICKKTFTLTSHLKRHILVHAGVKPHKCEICEKTFTRFSSLKQHNLIHEGGKPHKCEICEKTFIYLSHLKEHNLIHEGVKPYKCETCEKTFTRLSSLKRHNLIHEGVK